MRANFNNLYAEEGGDAGGSAATAEATPEAATPEATTGTPDVFGGTVEGESESAPASTGEATGNIIDSLYTSEGGLAENYTDLLRENGMENLASTVGKYKNADGLLKGAANLISFAGKKVEGVVVPTEGATEQEIAEYRQAIGVPESATAYEIEPENMPEGLEWNDEVGGFWQGKFHELGIPQEQASAIAQAYSDFTGQQLEQAHSTLDAQEQTRMGEMKSQVQKEWGSNYDKNMQAAVNMATTMGFDLDNAQDMAAVQNPKVLNMFLAKHQSMQEQPMPRGGETVPNGKGFREQANDIYSKYNGNLAMAPQAVRAKYSDLRKLQSKG